MKKVSNSIRNFLVVVLVGLLLYPLSSANAARVDELRNEIKNYGSEIQKIEQEISEYSERLSETRQKSNTLQSEIERIDTTRKKLSADINLTENKIYSTTLNLEKIGLEINATKSQITENKSVVAEAIRNINFADEESLVEIFLTHNSLSDFLQETNTLEQLQFKMQNSLTELRSKQNQLSDQLVEEQAEKEELSTLKTRLSSQKSIADENRREQSTLLAATKNQESNYQTILAQKLARKKQIESEIKRIEEQIRVEIDPNTLPSTASGVLLWPVKERRITQYFGNTPFASQNPQVYSGNGHNGIDLAASVGTPIFAAASGRVIGVDDTDRVCPGASYGKWVLIEHNNGLSTLYAHLSHSAVKEGDTVSAGQEIAYAGNSGYTTGPHLHFEVLASKAVRVTDGITELKSKSCAGAVYRIPLSGFNGKLNPLSYF